MTREIVSLSFILLLLTGFAVQAQTSFGFRGGLNVSGVSYNGGNINSQNFSSANLTGYHGGIMFNIGMFNILSIQPEILFDQRGSQITSDNTKYSLAVNYSTLNLLLKLDIPIGTKFKVNAHAGPYAGAAISGQLKLEGNGLSETRNAEIVTEYRKADADKPQVNLVDYGALFGVGVSYDFTPITSIFLDARYAFGMQDVQRYATEIQAGNPIDPLADWKKADNRATIVSLGIAFKVTQ